MVEDFGVYITALAPWRGNDHRHTVTQADGTFFIKFFGEITAFQLLFKGYKFNTGINPFGNRAGTRLMRMRCNKRRDVIKITIIFIISQDENGLFPDFRILGKDIQRFGYIPCPVPCRAGVIRKIFGSRKPNVIKLRI